MIQDLFLAAKKDAKATDREKALLLTCLAQCTETSKCAFPDANRDQLLTHAVWQQSPDVTSTGLSHL